MGQSFGTFLSQVFGDALGQTDFLMSEKASRTQLKFPDGPTPKVILDWRLVWSTKVPGVNQALFCISQVMFPGECHEGFHPGDKQNRSVWEVEVSTLTRLERCRGLSLGTLYTSCGVPGFKPECICVRSPTKQRSVEIETWCFPIDNDIQCPTAFRGGVP